MFTLGGVLSYIHVLPQTSKQKGFLSICFYLKGSCNAGFFISWVICLSLYHSSLRTYRNLDNSEHNCGPFWQAYEVKKGKCVHECTGVSTVFWQIGAYYSAEVNWSEGRHINRMPFTVEWWPAQHLMASHMALEEAHPFCDTHWNSPGRKNNGVSPHGCQMKKESCFVFFQKHRCFNKQHKVSVCVSVHVWVCVRAWVHAYIPSFTFTVLFRAALDHWNVLCHQKDSKKKKEKRKKTHQNKSMFAKLWEMLSGDWLLWRSWSCLKNEKKKQKNGNDRLSTSLSFSRR